MELCGKKVIVTGGVQGLGRSMVESLVDRGARVAVFDINAPGLDALVSQVEGVRAFQCDVADFDQVKATTALYHDEFGAADVLINNAGILHSEPLIRLGETGVETHAVATWNRVLAADLSSVFNMTACIVARMIATRTRGIIVNISSISAAGNVGQSAYSAAKAGVNALTATWAKELGPMGIRVLAVAPGFAETESTRQAINDAALRDIVKKTPLRRLGKPEDIAHGVISVIENDFVNGKVFEVDGGLIV